MYTIITQSTQTITQSIHIITQNTQTVTQSTQIIKQSTHEVTQSVTQSSETFPIGIKQNSVRWQIKHENVTTILNLRLMFIFRSCPESFN